MANTDPETTWPRQARPMPPYEYQRDAVPGQASNIGLLTLAVDALRDAIDASTRQGVNVHWEHLTPKLVAAHDAIAKYMEPKAND